jgi:hypothetical protein
MKIKEYQFRATIYAMAILNMTAKDAAKWAKKQSKKASPLIALVP